MILKWSISVRSIEIKFVLFALKQLNSLQSVSTAIKSSSRNELSLEVRESYHLKETASGWIEGTCITERSLKENALMWVKYLKLWYISELNAHLSHYNELIDICLLVFFMDKLESSWLMDAKKFRLLKVVLKVFLETSETHRVELEKLSATTKIFNF